MQEKKWNDRNKTPVSELSEHLLCLESKQGDSSRKAGYKRTLIAVMSHESLLPKTFKKKWMLKSKPHVCVPVRVLVCCQPLERRQQAWAPAWVLHLIHWWLMHFVPHSWFYEIRPLHRVQCYQIDKLCKPYRFWMVIFLLFCTWHLSK